MKKRIISTLLLSTVILSAAASFSSVAAETTDQKIAQQDQTVASAKSAKAQAQASMNSLQTKVSNIEASQAAAKTKLANLQKEAQTLNKQVATLRTTIKERTSNLEAQARSAQTDSSATSYLDAIVNSKSIADAAQKITAMATVTNASQQVLKQQKKDEESLQNKLEASQKNVGEADQLVQTLNDQAKELTTQQAQLQVATVNYQLTITTAQGKKSALLAEKATAEAAVKKATAVQNANTAAQNQAAADATASEKAASSGSTSTPASSSSTGSSSSNSGSGSNSGSTSNVGGYTNYGGSNKYAVNNCTWYVWNYYASMGVYLPGTMGNGADWANGPLAHTGKQAGAIVSFAAGTYIQATYVSGGVKYPVGSNVSFTTNGSAGHVGVVLKVYSNGSYLMGSGSTSGGWQQIIVSASTPGTYLWP